MHAPRDTHWNLVKRILRYLRGTMDHGISISSQPSTELQAYSNADWAGCPDTRRSTSGYCVFLGNSLISWSSKRQTTVSRSSAEAEYRVVANAVAECCWIRNLLQELQVTIDKATVIYCDNVSAVYLSENPVHHRRTKHVELDIHFVGEKVALGQFKVLQIPTQQQLADIMCRAFSPLFLLHASAVSGLCGGRVAPSSRSSSPLQSWRSAGGREPKCLVMCALALSDWTVCLQLL
jgi:hypothetical protein